MQIEYNKRVPIFSIKNSVDNSFTRAGVPHDFLLILTHPKNAKIECSRLRNWFCWKNMFFFHVLIQPNELHWKKPFFGQIVLVMCLFFSTKAFMCYVLNFFEKKAFMCLWGHVLIKNECIGTYFEVSWIKKTFDIKTKPFPA